MDACNPFPFNRLRTLSIAMGVYTPTHFGALLSVQFASSSLRGEDGQSEGSSDGAAESED